MSFLRTASHKDGRRVPVGFSRKARPRRLPPRAQGPVPSARQAPRFPARVPTKALVHFTRSFAVMVQARLSLLQALDTSAAQCRNARLEHILGAIRRDVKRGSSLSDSLARHPAVFNKLYVHLARVGEAAGILDQVMMRLATHLEKAAALKRKIQFALFYPVLILTVATGAIIFFLTAIVPTFAEMYADFGQPLPGPTRVVVHLSRTLTAYFPAVVLVSGAALCGIALLLRTSKGRRAWDRITLRLPGVGSLLMQSLTARFCRTLGTLLGSGVALVDALAIQAQASGNQYVEQELLRVLARVRRGSSLYQPLAQAAIFPDMVVQLVAVGEQTAELDGMLLHAAEHYEQEVEGYLSGLTALIEPVLIVVIGLMLGGILVALYLPMFELIHTVG